MINSTQRPVCSFGFRVLGIHSGFGVSGFRNSGLPKGFGFAQRIRPCPNPQALGYNAGMSDMIRPNKAVPVQARRVDAGPEVVQIPGELPPPAPGVTQNIIYVNMPAGQSPPPQDPSDLAEIHLHAHLHQHPVRRRGRPGTSFLGTLAFVVGSLACGAVYVPQMRPFAQWIAIGAGALAIISLFGAVLFRRVGQGMPLLGLLTAGAAYGLWMLQTGQAKLPKALSDGVSQIAATVQQKTSAAPTAPAPGPTPPATPLDAQPAPERKVDHSWFGDDDHPMNPSANKTAPAPSRSSTQAPTQAPPTVPPVPPAPLIDLTTARANVESARVNAARRLGVDYTTAKSTADDARAENEQVRQAKLSRQAPNSPPPARPGSTQKTS